MIKNAKIFISYELIKSKNKKGMKRKPKNKKVVSNDRNFDDE